jgi:proteasome accessory factor A
MKQPSRTAESNRPIFSRLAGLETEYAIRYRPASSTERLSKFQLFKAIRGAVEQRVLTAPARSLKKGFFTAGGGAVWFEAIYESFECGVVEGSTPECRGPRQLLLHQRAQDRLLGSAAESVSELGTVSLLKNDRDGNGNVYGLHENYEVSIGSRTGRILWRLGICCLLPFAVLALLGVIAIIVLLFGYYCCTALLCALAAPFLNPVRRKQLRLRLLGPDLLTAQETGETLPEWINPVLLSIVVVFAAPMMFGLVCLAKLVLFREVRRKLLPFLISRSVVCGSGFLDNQGDYHLATKLWPIRCVNGMLSTPLDRSVFYYGHFAKTLLLSFWYSPRDLRQLFGERLRLQIALGDSNMAEEAEYLRNGTTILILDAIESGAMPAVPRFRRPIKAMQTFAHNCDLTTTAKSVDGRSWTAIDLQRFYLDACSRFLEQQDDVPAEAYDVVRRWGEVLDALETDPEELVGRSDWVTKRFLLRQAGNGLSQDARKKIDLRYHELTGEGYFARLRQAEVATVLLCDEDELDRARRNAPLGTPATQRGRLIREFSGGDEPPGVTWSTVFLKNDEGRRVRVHLDTFQDRPAEMVNHIP